jgi:putative transposase
VAGRKAEIPVPSSRTKRSSRDFAEALVSRTQQPLVSGAIRGIFTATSHAEAHARLGQVVEQLRPHAPKVARLLEDAEADLLAFYAFPAEHWPKLRSTNPLSVNREIGRRSDVVGIFPNDAALLRLAGMLLLEQNDEWLVGRRYLSESSMALVSATEHPDPSEPTSTREVAQLTAS